MFNENLNRKINKVGLLLKKHSPEILAVAGVIGTVTSGVLACKATTKISKVLEEPKETIDKIHKLRDGELESTEPYTEEDAKKDLAITYTQAGGKLIKLYAPSVALASLSIGCMLTSNRILKKRNVALAAAYATVEKGFKEYRGRVVEKLGKDVDRELKYNIKAKEIQETITDENGKKKKVKKKIETIDHVDEHSEYAKFFDSSCTQWEDNSEYNLAFLKMTQEFANEKLRLKGHLFLNDVYDMLDIPRTKAGQIVGWVYDEKNPVGDNYVDFGIYELYSDANRRFVNGLEPVILLDFNVDGNILDLI